MGEIKIGKMSSSEIVTHEQSMNMLKANAKKAKDERKDRIKNAPINHMPSDTDKTKYIMYCVSHLKRDKDKKFMLCMLELTKKNSQEEAYKLMAKAICKRDDEKSIAKIKRIEEQIIYKVCNEIERLKLTGTPILGGL